MIIPEIYFNKQEQIKVSLPKKCSYCEELQTKNFFLFEKYAKSNKFENKIDIVCNNCLGKSNEEMLVYEYWSGSPVKVVSKINPSWNIIYFTPPSFKNSRNDMTTWDAADKQIGDEVIKDNSKWSFRNQNAPDSISFEEAQDKLRDKDLELLNSPEDPLAFLKEQQAAGIKAITSANKKLLKVDK